MIRVVTDNLDEKYAKTRDKVVRGLELRLLEQVDKIDNF